jgi:hypothetical protein
LSFQAVTVDALTNVLTIAERHHAEALSPRPSGWRH